MCSDARRSRLLVAFARRKWDIQLGPCLVGLPKMAPRASPLIHKWKSSAHCLRATKLTCWFIWTSVSCNRMVQCQSIIVPCCGDCRVVYFHRSIILEATMFYAFKSSNQLHVGPEYAIGNITDFRDMSEGWKRKPGKERETYVLLLKLDVCVKTYDIKCFFFICIEY